jgi:uncharacterized damage-inducible protein DinB
MINAGYVQQMARYNRWQNANLYNVADQLTDKARRLDRGAFFGSIHGTFNHLLWADQIWMSRFAGTPKPEGGIAQSPHLLQDWEELKRERVRFDDVIVDWADALDPAWIVFDLTYYSGAAKREMTRPKQGLLVHFFNHQTHHRGQLHVMLTQAGGKPHDTDLTIMPAERAAE